MRNLKKVLSLSLAFVMLLGMMIVGGSAATALDVYPDTDAINEDYLEAVDLLTAIDVLKGDDAGFRPTDTLTRAEAAKLVAYVALGRDAAEALSVTAAPFADVPANHWAAGYIAYCANVGIINGMGNNSFAPNDTVTGFQFAKMLLCCVGYGAKGEYTGANWALNVSKDGVTTKLFDRLDKVNNTPATREEAAQLAYNAIVMPMVAYSELYGTYGFYALEHGNQTLLGTKADKIFGVECKDFEDDLGYSYEYWKYQKKSEPITDNYLTDIILGTVTSDTAGAMYKDYDWNEVLEIWENGNAISNAATYTLGNQLLTVKTTKDGDTGHASADLKGQTNKVVTYNGQYIDVIDSNDDGDADKLVVVTNYLAKVTKVNAATSSKERSVNVDVYVPNAVEKITATFETEDYAKDDYILVTPSGKVTSIQAAAGVTNVKIAFGNIVDSAASEKVTGSVSAFYKAYTNNANDKQSGSVTTGGTKYGYNGILAYGTYKGLGNDLVDGNYTLNTATYNFYLDSFDNVIGVEVVEDTIKDYAYIMSVGEDAWQNYNVVRVLFSDGTVGAYTISDPDSYGYDNNKSKDIQEGEICAYSISGTNISFTKLSDVGTTHRFDNNAFTSDAQAKTGDFKKGYSRLTYTDNGGASKVVYTTDTTVFLYHDVANKDKITRFVGKSNAPDISNALLGGAAQPISVATETINGTTYATVVVVKHAPSASTSKDYLYITDALRFGESKDTSNGKVYYYRAILNGEKVNIAATNATLATTGVYSYTLNADAFEGDTANEVETGRYTLSTHANQISSTVFVKSNDNALVLGDTTTESSRTQMIVEPETTIIDLTSDPIDNEATVDVGDQVVIAYDNTSGLNVAKTIYITKAAVVMTEAELATWLATNTISANTTVTTTDGTVNLSNSAVIVSGATLFVEGNLDLGSNSITLNGDLYVTGAISGTGTITVADGASIEALGGISGVTLSLAGSATIKGDVTLAAAMTVAAGEVVKVVGDLDLNGKTLTVTGDGELEVTGTVTVDTLADLTAVLKESGVKDIVIGTAINSNADDLTIKQGVTVTASNAAALTVTAKKLTVEGTLKLTGSGALVLSDNAASILELKSGSVLDLGATDSITDAGAGTINPETGAVLKATGDVSSLFAGATAAGTYTYNGTSSTWEA